MPQDVGRLKRVLDVHGRVDALAAVLVEALAGLGAGGVEDGVVIYVVPIRTMVSSGVQAVCRRVRPGEGTEGRTHRERRYGLRGGDGGMRTVRRFERPFCRSI